MTLEIQHRGTRLVATQSGRIGWAELEDAFEVCAAWLDRDTRIAQLLFDLRRARLDLTGIEADQLAELVMSVFPRPVVAAVVEPEASQGRELLVAFADKLERLGVCLAICGSLKGAAKYLNALETGARPVPALSFMKQIRVEIERIVQPQELYLGSQ